MGFSRSGEGPGVLKVVRRRPLGTPVPFELSALPGSGPHSQRLQRRLLASRAELDDVAAGEAVLPVQPGVCPGRKPPLLAVKHPARPYKSAIRNRFTVGNAKGV